MASIHKEIALEAPADHVWAAIRDDLVKEPSRTDMNETRRRQHLCRSTNPDFIGATGRTPAARRATQKSCEHPPSTSPLPRRCTCSVEVQSINTCRIASVTTFAADFRNRAEREQGHTMASVTNEIITSARPERVWDAIRDIGALHTRLVVGFVLDTRLEPGARIVTFKNGMVVREPIVTVDDLARRLVWKRDLAGVDGRTEHAHRRMRRPPPLERMTKLFFEMNAYDIDTSPRRWFARSPA